MNKEELSKKSEELEQTLGKQLEFLKNDSKDWVKIGGLALAGGLLAFAIVNRKKNKKQNHINEALAVLEKEGLLDKDLEQRITASNKSSFWPSLSDRLLILGLGLAKEKILPQLFTSKPGDEESNEEGQ